MIARETGTLLNNLEEYSRCLVPTLTIKGTKEESEKAREIRRLRTEARDRAAEKDQETQEQLLKKRAPELQNVRIPDCKRPRLKAQNETPTGGKTQKTTTPTLDPAPFEPPRKARLNQHEIHGQKGKRKRPTDDQTNSDDKNQEDTHKTLPKKIQPNRSNRTSEINTLSRNHEIYTHRSQPEAKGKVKKSTYDEPQHTGTKPKQPSTKTRIRRQTSHTQSRDIRQYLTHTHKDKLNEEIPGKAEGGPDSNSNISKSKSSIVCNLNNQGGDKLTNSIRPMTRQTRPLSSSCLTFEP